MPRYIDVEYEKAISSDEREVYFLVTRKTNDYKIGKYIRKYKPSVAKLFSERTGDTYEQIH